MTSRLKLLLWAFCHSAVESTQPNFLLLFPDGWRYDWDGLNASVPIKMPFMRSMAARGVRFTQAYVPSPVCSPSRAALATGREYDNVQMEDVLSNDLSSDIPTIFQLLRTAGYDVMTVGKDDLTKPTFLGYTVGYEGCPNCKRGDGRYRQEELGFDEGSRFVDKVNQFQIDEDTYLGTLGAYLYNQTVVLQNSSVTNAFAVLHACYNDQIPSELCNAFTYTQERQEDVVATRMAIQLLKERQRHKPFFLQVAYLSPHAPHLVTAEMQAAVSGIVWPDPVDGTPGLAPGGAITANGQPNATFGRANYAAMLQNNDALFQEVLDEITRQGEYNNTIVIVSSDHGEILGDHGETGKSKAYQSSASVPLLIAGPNVPSAITVQTPVATLDIAGTILDLAGIIPADGMTTQSLKPLWDSNSSSSYRQFVSSGLERWRMVVQEVEGVSYKYVRCCDSDCLTDIAISGPGCDRIDDTNSAQFQHTLIDVNADPFDLVNLADAKPHVVAALCSLLPSEGYAGDWTTNCPKAEVQETSETGPTGGPSTVLWLILAAAVIGAGVTFFALHRSWRRNQKSELAASQGTEVQTLGREVV